MAIHVLEKLFEISPEAGRSIDSLTTPRVNIMYLRSTVSGNITEVTVMQANNITSGQAAFNLRLNGTQLFAGASRPIITAGNSFSTKTGLSIATLIKDVITLDLDEAPSGGATPPLTLLIKIDDGISGGGGGATTLDALTDVVVASPVLGDILRHDGTNFVNTPSIESLVLAISDETTSLTTGVGKLTFRMPYGFKLVGLPRANVNTVSSSGLVTVDINESGSSILSTKLSIDASEKTSTTAATSCVVSDVNLADDAEITIDIDAAGTGAKGLKVILIGYRTS